MHFQLETAVRLRDLYQNLREHFDYINPWWPGSPFEIAVTAVLVQQCDWSIAWDGVLRMREAGIGTLTDLAEVSPEELETALSRVAFGRTKSQRLTSIAQSVRAWGFETIEEFLSPHRETQTVRDAVLALKGIGPETADCWLNFASEHPVFVVDAYTRRIFERLHPTPHRSAEFWKKGKYADLQNFFHQHVLEQLDLYEAFAFPSELPRPVALLRDYHALLVELGKHHCTRSHPHCHRTGKPGWADYEFCRSHCLIEVCTACPLSSDCRYTVS